MAYQIEKIEGIGPEFSKKLATAGIKTTDDLLKQCATNKGRQDVARKTGVNETQLLKWANLADLMRIKGVASEYAELLEGAGVDTITELRTRNPENLTQQIIEVNQSRRLTRNVPNAKTVQTWIEEAKNLNPVITH